MAEGIGAGRLIAGAEARHISCQLQAPWFSDRASLWRRQASLTGPPSVVPRSAASCSYSTMLLTLSEFLACSIPWTWVRIGAAEHTVTLATDDRVE